MKCSGITRITLFVFAGLLAATAPGVCAEKGGLSAQQIDHMVREKWHQEEIVPAAPVDDAGYLRRIYIDITGTIPPAQAVDDFISDKSPDKRARAVDALLDGPGYADQWTDYWDGILMSGSRNQVVDRTAFRQWLHAQFKRNTPWNQFVYDLITASGSNSLGGTIAMASGARAAAVDSSDTTAINGATNWILKYQGKPEDLSGNASKIFLGVQIQCAQCHDHKTEKWKQTDFRSFTANFVNTRPKPIDGGRVKGNVRQLDLEDVNRPFQPRGKKAASIADYASAKPAALDGTDFSESPNRRKSLASWMVADDNPWFADAIVNRMWGHFLGRAFVEPIDDFRPSNPAVMPELMSAISVDFRKSNYDMKRLIKTICATQVYQLSSSSSVAKTGQGNLYWAKFRLKPMAPNQLLDSLVQAANVKPVLEQTVGANLEQIKFQLQKQFQFLFDVDEEFEQKDFEGTIPQALMLLNGGLVNSSVRPIPGTALAEVREMQAGDADKIESLYLRTLSRKPTAAESQRWVQYVNAPRETVNEGAAVPVDRRAIPPPKGGKKGAPNTGFNPLARATNQANRTARTPKDQAYEDLFWALLNSSEFLFNH